MAQFYTSSPLGLLSDPLNIAYDGDGSSHGTRGTVSLNSTSKKLIDQVRCLLLNFGIISNTTYSSLESINNHPSSAEHHIKARHGSYKLELNAHYSKVFYSKIGFRFERKQKNCNILNKKTTVNSQATDIIPNGKEIIRAFRDKTKISREKLYNDYAINYKHINGKAKLTRERLLKLYDDYKDAVPVDFREYLEKILSPNMRWVKITKIENNKNYTYDFSLPETDDFWCHSVLYNGILGHQTPRGVGSFYHTVIMDARKGIGIDADSGGEPWNYIELPWDVHPERDERWKAVMLSKMDKKKFGREYGCSFELSGDNVFNAELLYEYYKLQVQEPLHKDGMMKDFWVWKLPEIGRKYIMSADVARGDGTDFSTIEIIDAGTFEQVAEYMGPDSPKQLGKRMNTVGKRYNNALAVVENNSYGFGTLEELAELNYPNIYRTSKKNSLEVMDPKKVDEIFGSNNTVLGFPTSSKTRPIIVNNTTELFDDKSLLFYSQRLFDQFTTFIFINGKPQAMAKTNDDLIMAYFIANFVLNHYEKASSMATANAKSMLDIMMAVNKNNRGPASGKKPFIPMHSPSQQNTITNMGGVNIDVLALLDEK